MFESVTPDSIWNEMRRGLETDLQINEGSFTFDMLAPAVLEIAKLYKIMEAMIPMFYLDDSSGEFIDRQANVFGISRKNGTLASCDITFEGTNGTSVPAGAVFLTEDGLSFQLASTVILADGTGVGRLVAADTGAKYNIRAGEITRAQYNYRGVTSFANEAADGGSDSETDSALLQRFRAQLAKPPTSGNCYEFQAWATSINGIAAARVIALADGPGTVSVLLVGEDMQPATEEQIAAVIEFIDSQRLVGARVSCAGPETVPINASGSVTLAPGIALETVREAFLAAFASYIKDLVSEKFGAAIRKDMDDITTYSIPIIYNRLLSVLIGIDGVLDVQNFKVNGGTENIIVEATAIPVPGEVNIE